MLFDLGKRVSVSSLAVEVSLLLSTLLLRYVFLGAEPLSAALAFAALSNGYHVLPLIFSMFLSGVLTFSFEKALVYFLCGAVLGAFFFLFRRLNVTHPAVEALPLVFCAVAFTALFPSEYPFLGDLPPYFSRAVLSVFAVCLALVLKRSVGIAKNKLVRAQLTKDDILLVSLLVFLPLCGAYRLESHVSTALSLFGIYAFSAVFPLGYSLLFSLIVALPIAVVELSLSPFAMFAAFTLCAAFFLSWGKFPAAATSALVYGAFRYFSGALTGDTLSVALTLISVILPATAFCLLPKKGLDTLRKTLWFYRSDTLTRRSINRNRSAVGEKLFSVAEVFRSIENAFMETEDERPKEAEARKLMRGEMIKGVCATCKNKEKCFSSGMGASIDKLIAVGCMKGRVTLVDLPEAITNVCTNCNGLLFALNRQLGDYRRFTLEAENAKEGRKLLAMQARGVNELLCGLALEQSRPVSYDDEKEKALISALLKEGIVVHEVFLSGEADDILISLTVFGSYESATVAKVASAVLSIPLVTAEKVILSADKFAYTLKKKPDLDAVFGVTTVKKSGSEASGDTHSVLRIDEKRFLCALSDGMGSGTGAKKVSETAMGLLESFYRAGMNENVILSTVNKLLSFKREETFACIDLASVNLSTGRADVVKIGSPMGFVFSDGVIRVLEGDSLPLGMLDELTPTTLSLTLKDGDVMVFLSDGVTDAFTSAPDLFDYLKTLSPLNPQSFTDDIVQAAIKRSGGKAKDDMTALAVRIFSAA